MAQIFRAPKGNKNRRQKRAPQDRKTLNLNIESVDHQGQGVCRSHQPMVFVQGALPGETCEVDVLSRKSKVWHGTVKQVLTASEYRREPFCPHHHECGGCQTQHVDSLTMLAWKQDAVGELLKRAGHTTPLPWQSPIHGPSTGYRRKTRLAVDVRDRANPLVGFRAKGDNRVVPVTACEVLLESLEQLINPLQSLVAKLSQAHHLGHISLLQGDARPQVTFRITKPLADGDLSLLKDFGDGQDCQVVLESQGDEFVTLDEQSVDIHYTLSTDLKAAVTPNDFIQVNDYINQRMIAQALEWLALEPQDRVLDLFCGVGNFSLTMAARCKLVLGVEGVSKMVQRAEQNAKMNSLANTEFYCADLNANDGLQQARFKQVNKVLLDPAREGAGGCINQVAGLGAERILYVSCNPATFARDSGVLLEQGYELHKIGLMDMFPNTSHTELMALFVPLNKKH